MPAVIGVVFVFLVGVVVWVVATSGGDDPEQSDAISPVTSQLAAASPPVEAAEVATTPTLSPTPLPSTVPPGESTAPATTESTTSTSSTTSTTTSTTLPPPATTAPGADSGAVPGDLAVPGRPMQQPSCDGSYITVLASSIGAQASAASVASVLEQYSGSNYLRTDQTCASLTPAVDGEPVYVIFYGPFAVDSDACAARVTGPEGAYARQLSNDLDPTHFVTCA